MSDIILRKVRLSFPDLFHAVEYQQGDGRPRWNATFLIEPGSTNDELIREAIQEAARDAWGEKAPRMLAQFEGNANKFCYLDGSLKEYDGYEGMWYLACHRNATLRSGSPNARPAIIDRDKSPLTEEDGRPYAGCFVNAKVSLYGQAGENAGLRASFSVVQFDSDGPAFSGSAPTIDEFDALPPDELGDDLL